MTFAFEVLLVGRSFCYVPWSPFLESPGNSVSESQSKIPNLTIAELFYSRIFDIKRGSLHAYTRLRFYIEMNENGLTGPKSFRGFRETGPCCEEK